MTEVDRRAKKAVRRQRRELEGILNKFNEGSALVWIIFVLTSMTTLFSGLHLNVYGFIAEVPMHWCAVSELSQANWTDLQIRNVSSATSCTRYSYNYSYMSTLSFEEALAFAEDHRDVAPEKCTHFSYADGTEATSIAIKWDLVCDRTAMRSSVQMSAALGKLIGSLVFGVFNDRFGRRIGYIIGVIILNVCGLASAFVPWYWLFVVLRVLIGASITAVYISAFTILSETAVPKHRNWMSLMHYVGYSVGMMILSGIAYGIENWQLLQLTISLTALVPLLLYRLMPESPRWLLSQNRCAEAITVMKKLCGPHIFDVNGELKSTERFAESDEEISEKVDETRVKQTRYSETWNYYVVIYSNSELRRRMIILCLEWFISCLSYYEIALNGKNFAADQYIYIFSMGFVGIPAHLLLPLLSAGLGRRLAVALTFFVTSAAMLCVLAIRRSETVAILAVAIIGRSAIAAVYCNIVAQTSELFPTVVRNTALSNGMTAAFAGGILAPFVVDFLGEEAWWAPSTLCGIACLIAGSLSLLLPETRGRPLAATVSEEVISERGKTSIRNCCAFQSAYA